MLCNDLCRKAVKKRMDMCIPDPFCYTAKTNTILWISYTHWLHWSLSMCGPQKKCPEKSVCMSKNNRTRHGITDWSQIGKGVHQGCILSPCLFNIHAEYIMQNAGLDEAQVGIKIARRNINNLRYADNTALIAESKAKRNWRPSWWKWKRRVKKLA